MKFNLHIYSLVYCFQCHSQETVAQSQVMKFCPYVFFQEFYITVKFSFLIHLQYGTLVKNQTADVRAYIYVSTMLSCLLQLCDHVLKLGHVTPPALFFFKIVLGVQSPLKFHINFRVCFSIIAKNAYGISTEIALNLYIALGSIVMLTILSLLIFEHRMSLYLSLL